jgi:hypothetical protein
MKSHGKILSKILTLKDLFFSQQPKAPKNLKGVVILVPSLQKNLLGIGIGAIANVRYSHNFMQVVDCYETANQLLIQKLG